MCYITAKINFFVFNIEKDFFMTVQFQPVFTGNNPKHGARNIYEVMNKLYQTAYKSELYKHEPDIIQISSKMDDGTEISAIADFEKGKCVGISFPYEFAKYRYEFNKKILDKYNNIITKGKSKR